MDFDDADIVHDVAPAPKKKGGDGAKKKSAKAGKAPAAAETESKRPLSRNRVSVRTFRSRSPHTQVRLHPCGLACHVPRRRRLNSHRAQLPLHHTPAALRTRCAPHHSHPTTYLHFRSSNAPLPYSFVIKPSTGR